MAWPSFFLRTVAPGRRLVVGFVYVRCAVACDYSTSLLARYSGDAGEQAGVVDPYAQPQKNAWCTGCLSCRHWCRSTVQCSLVPGWRGRSVVHDLNNFSVCCLPSRSCTYARATLARQFTLEKRVPAQIAHEIRADRSYRPPVCARWHVRRASSASAKTGDDNKSNLRCDLTPANRCFR